MDEEIEEKIQKLENRVTALESALIGPREAHAVNKKISVKEFVLQKKPKDDVQRTLVVGYYLERFAGMKSFNTRDLEEAFRSAKEPAPENINYKIIRNIGKGYVMEDKEKKESIKAWMLTNSGEEAVEGGFDEE